MCRSIVTPRISGLNYTEAIEAMLQAGLRYAVGDNSREDLRPANPFHGFLASAKVWCSILNAALAQLFLI
jgi:hypothetical protein